MRNLILITILIICSYFANSQITLEHTFSSESGYFSYINTNNQTMYWSYNTTTGVLILYADDYSLYKSITISPPTGYQNYSMNLSILTYSLSTKVFNTDDLVEFASLFQSTSDPNDLKLLLYNENLQLLKDFGNRGGIYTFRTVDNETKCGVSGFTLSGSQITYFLDIYHLPGNLPVDVDNVFSSIYEPIPFPNPTRTYIAIPISLNENETTILNIFNQNGQIIESRVISGFEKILNIDVQEYTPGLYFYQYNNIKEKFIVAK